MNLGQIIQELELGAISIAEALELSDCDDLVELYECAETEREREVSAAALVSQAVQRIVVRSLGMIVALLPLAA